MIKVLAVLGLLLLAGGFASLLYGGTVGSSGDWFKEKR